MTRTNRPAPRVDKVRGQIDATRELLARALDIAHVLHTLAYNRQTADEVRVRGGWPDYALDTHGDPRARHAYRTLADTLLDVASRLSVAGHDAVRIVNEGEPAGTNRQHPATIQLAELAEALDARARRIAAGDVDTPRRAGPQPKADAAITHLVKENRTLRAQVVELRTEVARLATTQHADA
jgi:hypothetical protein